MAVALAASAAFKSAAADFSTDLSAVLGGIFVFACVETLTTTAGDIGHSRSIRQLPLSCGLPRRGGSARVLASANFSRFVENQGWWLRGCQSSLAIPGSSPASESCWCAHAVRHQGDHRNARARRYRLTLHSEARSQNENTGIASEAPKFQRVMRPTWGLRRGCAGAAPVRDGPHNEDKWQEDKFISEAITMGCTSPVRAPPEQHRTSTRAPPSPHRGRAARTPAGKLRDTNATIRKGHAALRKDLWLEGLLHLSP